MKQVIMRMKTKEMPKQTHRFALLNKIRIVRDYSKGFTIAEVLVSIAIFAVVASMAVAVFTRVLRSQRSIVSLLNVSDNTSIAIEAMMREMRFGRNFQVLGISSAASGISFEGQPPERKQIEYHFNLEQESLERSENGGVPFAVTTKNVKVKDVSFALAQEGDGPSRITMTIVVASDKRDIAGAQVTIQTTVSQRMVNNPQ